MTTLGLLLNVHARDHIWDTLGDTCLFKTVGCTSYNGPTRLTNAWEDKA